MKRRILAIALLSIVWTAGVAHASWYDDYDAGLAAAKKGNWSVVAQKMSAAIKGNPNENNKARTYGAIFINYHPYYYRGVANLNLGRYEEAIADLEKTSGPGPENLGSIDALIDRAKKQLASAAEPDPVPTTTRSDPRPTPPVVTPTPVVPTAPQIDPALRQRASAALANAKQKLQAAQSRKATSSPQYSQAMSGYSDAMTRNSSARSNDDLNAVITMAESAGDFADLAMPPSVATPTPVPTTTSPITPKPTVATGVVMSDYTNQVRTALELYFAGEFDEASKNFEELSRLMPNNGWIWAFLGASQYSQYAFEADDGYRTAALRAFRKARQYPEFRNGLPSKYFSKRIQKAFRDSSG